MASHEVNSAGVDKARAVFDIACVYRASEWRHKSIELAAHDLLQRVDDTTS